MILLALFAFIAGIVTVLSPCILPVLPIVLSGSVGGRAKPYGVVTGFIFSFTFFTLFLSSIVQATGLSANALRLFSVVIIVGFGLSLLIPQTQLLLEKMFTVFSRFSPRKQRSGFFGGILVGLSLGLIWTPCVGPILASVISLAITGSVSGAAAIITLAYALGTGIPMLAIAVGGNKLLQKVPWLLQNTSKIQKVFGVVMIVTGLGIFFNIDRQFQTFILDTFPQYGSGLTSFENNEFVNKQLDKLSGNEPADKAILKSEKESSMAPEIIPGGQWFNSEPFTIDEMRGKVVLVDFWTYSCINCIRTLPYLKDWHDTYADKGLVILGVHSPEFEFEKNVTNVQTAIEDFEIEYPVVQDNDFKTWRAYNNRFWPAKYLVDKNGKIRYTHFGEGKYEETENIIRELLGEEPISEFDQPIVTSSKRQQTAETYLGYGRADAYVIDIDEDQLAEYSYEGIVPNDAVSLNGSWLVNEESITAKEPGSRLSLNFQAQQVYLVLEPNKVANPQSVQVLLDGQPLPQKYWTDDMNENGEIAVDSARKYDILDLEDDYGRHTLTLIFDPGISAFAFTFGS